jgi:DNA-binding NtrC family response regulator
MARIAFVGLDQIASGQIGAALEAGAHQVQRKSESTLLHELTDTDMIFAGGEPQEYMSLLKQVRQRRPAVPFVVVTRIPETREWLDALEAGATDYCSAPFEKQQIHWLMESALLAHSTAAA